MYFHSNYHNGDDVVLTSVKMLFGLTRDPQPSGIGGLQQLSGTTRLLDWLLDVLNQPLANQSLYEELPQQLFYKTHSRHVPTQ